MLTRRKNTQLLVLSGGGLFFSSSRAESSNSLDSGHWFMPEESDRHKRTRMSFIGSYDIWEERQVPEYGTKDFAAGYVGYYVCNGAIIMQKFGDRKTDNAAKAKLEKVFPNHRIEQIAIDGIASGGGSIHCTTQQEPKV